MFDTLSCANLTSLLRHVNYYHQFCLRYINHTTKLNILPLKCEVTNKTKNLTSGPFIRQPFPFVYSRVALFQWHKIGKTQNIKLLNNVHPGQIILTAPFENYEANKSLRCNWLIILHKRFHMCILHAAGEQHAKIKCLQIQRLETLVSRQLMLLLSISGLPYQSSSKVHHKWY